MWTISTCLYIKILHSSKLAFRKTNFTSSQFLIAIVQKATIDMILGYEKNGAQMQLRLFTLGFESSCHCGVKKKRIPLDAPSSVTDRISNAIIMTYGNMARKYEHLPELLTPRDMIKNVMIHEPNRHNVNCQLG